MIVTVAVVGGGPLTLTSHARSRAPSLVTRKNTLQCRLLTDSLLTDTVQSRVTGMTFHSFRTRQHFSGELTFLLTTQNSHLHASDCN